MSNAYTSHAAGHTLSPESDLREKVSSLLKACEAVLPRDPAAAEGSAKEALALSYELQDKRSIADSLFGLALANHEQASHTQAINSLLEALKIYGTLSEEENIVRCHIKLGEAYLKIRDYENALANYLEAIRIQKSSGNTIVLADLYNRTGSIYQNTRDYPRAIESYHKALKIYEELGDEQSITIALFAIGNAYNWADDLQASSLHLHRSEEKAIALGDDVLKLKVYSSLAILYTKLEEYERSLEYFEIGLELTSKLNDRNVRASMLKSLGNLYNKLGQYDNALKALDEALKLAEDMNLIVVLTLIHQFYADTYELLGDHKKALHHHKEYYRYDKQIVSEEIKLKTKGLQARLDLEEARKEKEIYRLRNIDLAQAYEEIIRQKTEIQQKNKEITDSINYARKIQEAILPSEEQIKKHLSDYFIFYKPKDIVSGDFYFFTTVTIPSPDKADVKTWVVMAAVDCTGHGVPGAFMSMIGNNILNQIVNDKKVTSPSIALSVLDQKVVHALNQYKADTNINDGMDVALCAIDFQNLYLQYAGAHRPLILIRNGELMEYKASKYAIGGYHRDDKMFLDETLRVQKGDTVYMFTDGYADQFGGPKGKKFKYKKLVQLLQSIHHEPMSVQHRLLGETFDQWRGDLEQVDDILLIGIRI
jgi:serine phosphatase RsbU (regulator of sigma subunit)/Tfp pilus assembly protein PilF